MFVFWKIWCALFSCNTCFKFRSLALLPTKYIGVTFPKVCRHFVTVLVSLHVRDKQRWKLEVLEFVF